MDSILTSAERSDPPRPDSRSCLLGSQRSKDSTRPDQNARSAVGGSSVVRRSRRSIDAAVVELAKRQLGVVATSQLVAVGINRKRIQARVDSGMLVRFFPNVLQLASIKVSAEQQFLAAALSVPGSVVSGRSAAFVHGFPSGVLRALLPADVSKIEVELSVLHKRVIDIKGINARRCRRTIDIQTWKGVKLTTIPQTVADLAAILSTSELSMLLDHLLVKRLTKVTDIRKVVLKNDRMVNRQRLLALLDERSEGRMLYRSRLEFKVGGWLNDLGVKGFHPNYVVREADGIEADFAWPSHRVVLEVSPFYTHGAERTQERDMIRRRKLLAAGWLVFEVTDADLISMEAFALAITPLLDLLSAPRTV